MRILCSVDVEDPFRRHVLGYAIRVATRIGASLHVLHVHELSSDVHDPTSVELDLRGGEEKLRDLLAGTDELSIRVTSEQLTGSPYEQIRAEAERRDVDLLVMGTHARSGLSRFFLGSVAERVLRTSDVPVITVPVADRMPPSPPRSMLVAYDFSECARRALERAHDLAVRFEAEVGVVHVLPEDRRGDASGQTSEHERFRASVARRLAEDVAEVFGAAAEGVTLLTLEGRAVDEIRAAQRDLGADLMVVGASGKGAVERILLGSVATGLLRGGDVAMLTVP